MKQSTVEISAKKKEGEWLEADEAKDKISEYILYYCNNNANHANYIAEILQQTLACETANCGTCCLL